jgi:hypothetical protein
MQGELKGKAGLVGVFTHLEFSYYIFNNYNCPSNTCVVVKVERFC